MPGDLECRREAEEENPFQRYNSGLEEDDLAQVQMGGSSNGNFRPSCPSYLQKKHQRLMHSPDRSNDIDQRFILQKLLGEGAYGKVYKAIDKKTNQVSPHSPSCQADCQSSHAYSCICSTDNKSN